MSGCNNLSYGKMRQSVKNGEFENKRMRLSAYENLLDNEAGFENPSAAVLEFCVAGMKRFRKYKKQCDAVVLTNAVANRLHHERNPREMKSTFGSPKRKKLVFAAIVVALLVTLVGCAAFFDLFAGMLNVPLLTKTEQDGRAMLRTEDERFYSSLEDLLAIEEIDILHPETLPGDYEFTDFEVINVGSFLEVKLYAEEPYIVFNVRINVDVQMDDFDGEINELKYRVVEHKGLYQAYWVDSSDYYMVAVSDETVIIEIIESLTRN